MFIRYGFAIDLLFQQPATFFTLMDIHPDRRSDIVSETSFELASNLRMHRFIDAFGNICRRIETPGGLVQLRCEGLIEDSGKPDPVVPSATQTPVERLPPDTLRYLAASRYCETDLMSNFAWQNFGHIVGGWQKVQAICDFVHDWIRFDYGFALPTRTAAQVFEGRVGVCRDFAHLAVTLCRCLNIPARYCNGYLGDIGVPFNPDPMDFNAWFEVYLDGAWLLFDARHNERRIGRITIARGRDAVDTAMISSFGPHILQRFEVTTAEEPEPPAHIRPAPQPQVPRLAVA